MLFVTILAWIALIVSLVMIILKIILQWDYEHGSIQKLSDELQGIKHNYAKHLGKWFIVLFVSIAWIISVILT